MQHQQHAHYHGARNVVEEEANTANGNAPREASLHHQHVHNHAQPSDYDDEYDDEDDEEEYDDEEEEEEEEEPVSPARDSGSF